LALEKMLRGSGEASESGKGRQKAKSYQGKDEHVDWSESEGRLGTPASQSVLQSIEQMDKPQTIVIRLKKKKEKSTVVVILPRRCPVHLPCHAMPPTPYHIMP
jgi:hypothetical protein